MDPADALQLGIYSRLTSDAPLMSLVTGVYDGVREFGELDYVTIGEMTSSPDGVHGVDGRQTVASIHTWTRAESHAPGNTIAGHVVGLLLHQHVALDSVVSGHRVWRVTHEFAQNFVDPEPHVRHRVDRFRIYTSEG